MGFLKKKEPTPPPTPQLRMPQYFVTGGKIKDGKYPEDESVKTLKFAQLISNPRKINWEEAMKFYDFSRSLPKPEKGELSYQTGFMIKKNVTTQHLPRVFEKIYNKRFTDPKYDFKNSGDPKDKWVLSFGDMMLHFKSLRGKAKETEDSLKKIETKYPAIWMEVKHILPQLVRNDFLYSENWTPWEDESSKGRENDGILFIPYWKIKENKNRSLHWNKDLDQFKVYQGGVFMYSSLQKIKAVERHYQDYPKHIGMGYLEVFPLENSYMKGVDPRGNEFNGLEVYFRQDLPFPYESSKFTMKYFDFYNEDGYYISDYYSLDRNDLNWMAGRDTFFNVRTLSGNFVGWLIATELGYDIKNLPERDQDRVVSIKGAWGNIKLISEGYFGLSKVSSATGKLKQ